MEVNTTMPDPAKTILLITRNENDNLFLRPLLEREGAHLLPLYTLSDPSPPPREIRHIIIDLNFGMEKLETVLQWCHKHYPLLSPLILSPFPQEALKTVSRRSSLKIIKKPFSAEELLTTLFPHDSLSSLNPPSSPLIRDGEFLSASPKMEAVYELVRQVAPTDASVLLRGETGTGKEIIAGLIHRLSQRKNEKMVTINCAALPETLLESELFGYEKGAFSGAATSKEGKFEYAHNGTLLLDEIGDMALSLQAKVLRVLQEKAVERLGGHQKRQADVRVISATNQPLEELMSRGLFRDDLYYRLNVISVTLPPLRQRPEDILLLSEHFLHIFKQKYAKEVEGFSHKVKDILTEYFWPGNVRELKNLIESFVILTKKHLITDDLIPESIKNKTQSHSPRVKRADSPLRALEEHEKEAIRKALRTTRGNKKEAARILGIARSTLYNKIKRYGLS